jgi:hypothetical protein
MSATFTVTFTVPGKNAREEQDNVAWVLKTVARQIDPDYGAGVGSLTGGPVTDAKNNVIGQWTLA